MLILKNEADVLEALAGPSRVPAVIYKHSQVCGLCDIAILEFRKFMDDDPDRFRFYQVDVIGARAASRKIEELLGVRHESPQVLMVWNRVCHWHGSHRKVKAETLRTEAAALRTLAEG